MFNLGKKEVLAPQAVIPEEMQDKAVNMVANVKNNVLEVTGDIKRAANKVGNKIEQSGLEAKQEASNLMDSLKALLADYTTVSNATEIKDQLIHKAAELKNVVQDEATQAYQVSKERAAQTVQEKPLLSLAVALGAGVLVGYILGTKQSSK
jgi:ElaB/YqjD/DUF883 family membrane-anchored ribosome-binding protein